MGCSSSLPVDAGQARGFTPVLKSATKAEVAGTIAGYFRALRHARTQSSPTRSTNTSDSGSGSASSDRTAYEVESEFIASEEWKSKASILAGSCLPFVPARVVAAFAEGGFRDGGHGAPLSWYQSRADVKSSFDALSPEPASSMPAPRTVSAAVLLLDVSGFTALSEDARRRLGSEGVEGFGLALSAFFQVMISIIVSHHGDIDCFAGDAVLVVFEPRDDDDRDDVMPIPGSVFDGDRTRRESAAGMAGAARRALKCAMAVHKQLDGFRNEPEDPPLGLHSALAAGRPPARPTAGVA